MPKVYKSKIGFEIIVPIIFLLGAIILLSLSKEPAWLGLIILLPVILFIAHMFLTTYYIIHDHQLTIKSGFLFHKIIDIHTIQKIAETNNPISSPATSLDRIVITYNKHDSVIISPKAKQDFINHLIALNPNIVLKFKAKS